jgi:hypothetical protein
LSSDALQLWAMHIGATSQSDNEPVLTPGVHLRWDVSKTRGFPWGGYYLLRKERYFTRTREILVRWQSVPLFSSDPKPDSLKVAAPQPLALPIDHPDYPPAGFISYQGKILGEIAGHRVTRNSGDLADPRNAEWARLTDKMVGSDGDRLQSLLATLVQGGMTSTPMAERELALDAEDSGAAGTAGADVEPVLPSVLDAVLMASAFPVYAQYLGIYAIDVQPQSGSNTYVVVADYGCRFIGDVGAALAWAEAGFPKEDGLDYALCGIEIGIEPVGVLPEPNKLFSYLLPPGPPSQEQGPYSVAPKSPSVGLAWESQPLQVGSGKLLWPVLYQIERADVGPVSQADWQYPSAKLATAVKWEPMLPADVWHLSTGTIEPLGADAVESAAEQGEAVSYPLDPTMPPVAMHYVDDKVQEAWYAYRIRTQDWFGRISDWSSLATWKSWPWTGGKANKPWYSKFADSFDVVHKHFVLAADGTGPQGPAFSVHNLALASGAATAQVRWSWSWADFRQSPIAPNFRIYARPGRSNVYRGTLVEATFANPMEPSSVVALRCSLPGFVGDSDLLYGSTLRMSGLGLTISLVEVGSKPPKFICVLPGNKTIADLRIGGACSVVVPQGHKLWQDPHDIRSAPWVRLPPSPTRTGKLSFEVFRASVACVMQGEVTAARVAELQFALGGEVPLQALAAGAASLDFQVELTTKARWSGKLLSCDAKARTAVVQVQPGQPWNGTNQPISWRIGYNKAASFEIVDAEPGIPATGPVTLNASVIGHELAIGGLVPLDGVQPGDQVLALKSGSSGPLVYAISACDPVSRLVTIRPTGSQTLPPVPIGMTWQIGRMQGNVFTPDLANVGQPLYGPVTAATDKTLKLGGPAALDGVLPGLWSLMLAPLQANGQVNLVDGQVLRLKDVDVSTRTATLEDTPVAPKVGALTDLYWYLGQPVAEYQETVTLDAGQVAKATDSGKVTFEFAVTTADGRQFIPDWIGASSPLAQPGAEGPPSSIAVATADVVVKVPVPQIEVSAAPRKASAPDINGRSFATIRWPKVINGTPVHAMAILRASASAVFLANEQAEKKSTEDVKTVLNKYAELKFDDQLSIAASPNVLSCYAPVTSAPLLTGGHPEKAGPDDPAGFVAPKDQAAYIDTLDGRVPGQWFYRLQPYDALGQAGPVAPGAIAVQVQGEDRPQAPVIVSAWFGTEAEHLALADAKSAEKLLEELAKIKTRTISIAWKHDDPQGRSWVVEMVSEDGQQRLRTEFGPIPVVDGKLAADLEVPSGGRWRINLAAVGRAQMITSAVSLGWLVAVPK